MKFFLIENSAHFAAYFLALSTGILMVIIPNQYEAINLNDTITAVVLIRINLVVGIISFIALALGLVFALYNLKSVYRVKGLIIAVIISWVFVIWYVFIPLPIGLCY